MVLSSRAQSYIIGNDVLMVFSGLVVSIRFYIRMRHSQRGLWWDDLSILMSMVREKNDESLISKHGVENFASLANLCTFRLRQLGSGVL